MKDKKTIELSPEDIEKVSGGTEPPEGEEIHEGSDNWNPINAKDYEGNLKNAAKSKKKKSTKK